MNRDHSVIFEIVSKYCISDSFVDAVGYSISSKRFLPIVVDIMVSVMWQPGWEGIWGENGYICLSMSFSLDSIAEVNL